LPRRSGSDRSRYSTPNRCAKILVGMASPPQQKASFLTLPTNVKLLGLASLLNDIASEMIFPLLPDFLITVLGGNKLHLGIIEGVADSISSLLRLWSGAWSDRTGWRKGFVVFGYAVAAVARPLAGLARVPWHLLAIRATDRIGKGIRTSPRDALIADSTEEGTRGRAFGFHQAMDHFGAATGPLLAAFFLFLWPNRLRELFLLTFIPGIAVIALLVLGLREKKSSLRPAERVHLTLRPFGGAFRMYLLALTLFTLGNSSDAFLLVRAGELGIPRSLLPLLWCAFHVVKTAANLAAGVLSDRLGPKPLLIFGWAAYAVVYLAFALATSGWQVGLIFLCYGVVYSLTEPTSKAFVTALTSAQTKGLAFGWFNFAVGIMALPSSLLFGWLYQRFGAGAAFGWGSALALIAAAVLLTIRAPGRNSTSAGKLDK
jgi:MFS family permease